MARELNLTFDNITVPNAAATLAMIRPGANFSLRVVKAWLGESLNATSVNSRIHLCMQAAALPTTLTAKAPEPLNRLNTSEVTGGTSGAAGTSGINSGTTTEGGGTRTILVTDVFNHVTGWIWHGDIFLPAGHASAFAMFFPAAMSVLTNWSGGMTVQVE